ECVSCGIVPTGGYLGTDLLWDHASKKIFLVNFRKIALATEKDTWDEMLWVSWGFGREVKRAAIAATTEHDTRS
ncbi:hypothetical protein UA08_03233, partial [Talaromyces atroroseus]